MRLNWKHWIPAFAGMTGALLLVMTAPVYADCVYMDGGYCVSKMTDEIAVLAGVKVGEAGAIEGIKYLQGLESIWNILIEKKLAVKEDMDKAFAEAGKAGGTKIGGVNLVVLSARTLQQLIDKNILTKEDAQGILNGARTGLPRPAGSQ